MGKGAVIILIERLLLLYLICNFQVWRVMGSKAIIAHARFPKDSTLRCMWSKERFLLQGGLGSASASAVPLSAYVAIALSEAGHFGAGALPAAVSCIASDTAATDVYSESLKAYALALASSADAPAHITAAYDLLTAGDDEGESIWVESAAYTVLAMLKVDHLHYVSQAVDLIRRMSSHRNSLGGFHSTQVCDPRPVVAQIVPF